MRKAIAILILSGIVFIASACGAASTVPEASADQNEVSDSQSAEVPEPEPEAEPAKLEDLDVLEIFQALFLEKYEIQSMYLIDDYWTGDAEDSDTESVDANNTSAFCYREITGGGNMSNHAYGLAIDLNPQQNPYVSYRTGEPVWWHENANDYIDRDAGLPHMITHEDLAYELFTQHGFEWGGDWDSPKDYQHFEKN